MMTKRLKVKVFNPLPNKLVLSFISVEMKGSLSPFPFDPHFMSPLNTLDTTDTTDTCRK